MNDHIRFTFSGFLFIFLCLLILSFPKQTFADWCSINDAPQGWACGGANYCSGGDVVNDWGYCDRSSGISTCFITEPAKVHENCTVPDPFPQCGAGANACINHPDAIASNHTVYVTPIAGCSSGSCTATYNCDDLEAQCGQCGNVCATPTPTPTPAPSDASTCVLPLMVNSGNQVTSGQSYPAQVSMRNDGGTTWTTAASYNLGSSNPRENTVWGPSRVALPSTITPGNTAFFNFNVTAPSVTSQTTKPFYWEMVKDGPGGHWFGSQCQYNVTVNPAVVFTPLDPVCDAYDSTGSLITTATTGQSVTWKARVSGGTSPFSYSWSGSPDSVTGSSSSATKTYTTSGSKTATVTVTDSSSPIQSKSANCSVTITAPAPTVTCSSSPNPTNSGTTVTWTATSTGGTAPYSSYSWRFDDGTTSTTTPATSTTSTTTKNYTNTSSTNVTKTAYVKITDSAGQTSSENSCTVTITAPSIFDYSLKPPADMSVTQGQ